MGRANVGHVQSKQLKGVGYQKVTHKKSEKLHILEQSYNRFCEAGVRKFFLAPPIFPNFCRFFTFKLLQLKNRTFIFIFVFFPKIPRSICLTWPKNSEKSLFLDFYFFLRIYRSVYRPTAANGLIDIVTRHVYCQGSFQIEKQKSRNPINCNVMPYSLPLLYPHFQNIFRKNFQDFFECFPSEVLISTEIKTTSRSDVRHL